MGDPDYHTPPPTPRLDETVTITDPDRAPDADDVRNGDQHAALRDDRPVRPSLTLSAVATPDNVSDPRSAGDH